MNVEVAHRLEKRNYSLYQQMHKEVTNDWHLYPENTKSQSDFTDEFEL